MSSKKNTPTEAQVHAVYSLVRSRGVGIRAHLDQNRDHWLRQIRKTWENRAQIPTPLASITSLAGRPPTTIASMLLHLHTLRLSVERGVIAPSPALTARLDKLAEVTRRFDSSDPRIAEALDYIDVIRGTAPTRKKGPSRASFAAPSGAPAEIIQLFALVKELGE